MYSHFNRTVRAGTTRSVSLLIVLFSVVALGVNSANAEHNPSAKRGTLVNLANPMYQNYPPFLHEARFGSADISHVTTSAGVVSLPREMYVREEAGKEDSIFLVVFNPEHTRILVVRQYTPDPSDGNKSTIVWAVPEFEFLVGKE